MHNLAAQQVSNLTADIAVETQRDSVSMFTLALVTAIFLPGTFICVSIQYYPEPSTGRMWITSYGHGANCLLTPHSLLSLVCSEHFLLQLRWNSYCRVKLVVDYAHDNCADDWSGDAHLAFVVSGSVENSSSRPKRVDVLAGRSGLFPTDDSEKLKTSIFLILWKYGKDVLGLSSDSICAGVFRT